MSKKIIFIIFLFSLAFYAPAQLVDTSIVLINLGHLDRNHIAEQIEMVKRHRPKVIALDVTFTKDSLENDSSLVTSLKTTPNLVMVCYTMTDPYGNTSIKKSHAKFSTPIIAHANLLSSPYKKGDAISAFEPFVQYADQTYPAFAITLANAISPSKTAGFLNKHIDETYIPIRFNYPFPFFITLSESELSKNDFNSRLLQNKIVIIGFLGPGEEDLLPIPVMHKKQQQTMYGARIHAHIVHTILNE